MKDNDKITLTFGQLKELFEESKQKKVLKESGLSEAQDIISGLAERAQEIIDEGERDIGAAVAEAINTGLFQSHDIHVLLSNYGTISDKQIVDSYYEDLFDDVAKEVEVPEDDYEDIEDDEEE